jgi:hypothetical protein
MNMKFVAAIGVVMVASAVAPSQTLAQQKTIEACQQEWRANRAVNQTNGITEKSFVAQCRGGGSPQPTSAPAPQPASVGIPPLSPRAYKPMRGIVDAGSLQPASPPVPQAASVGIPPIDPRASKPMPSILGAPQPPAAPSPQGVSAGVPPLK